jgi:RNA polymerase sigma-70 factor (ECF subfamily)
VHTPSRDLEQAKDLMQDTFLKAYKNFYSFQGGNIKGWLFRIVRNLTFDYIRKKKTIKLFFDKISNHKMKEPLLENIAILNESERELFYEMSKINV